jgi:hypothetical protein
LLAAAVIAGLACLSGCDRSASAGPPGASAGPPDAAAPTPPASSGRTAPPAPPSSGSAAPEKPQLQVLKLVFTSEVKNKEPVDKLERAQPGQRVYAHLTLRNRGAEARPITLAFKVNGEARSKVDLKVDPSWSFRTWGYNTLRASDLTGELSLEVRDDTGAVLTTARLPIRTDPPAKPLPGTP